MTTATTSVNLKELSKKPELLAGGHRLCAGCMHSVIVRQTLLAADTPVIATCATGCLEVATSIHPYTAWRVPWIHSAFENAAATASGMEAMFVSLKKQGKLPADADVRFIAFGGDGGTYDIGFQALSGALERGHRMLYICCDNGAYMNTGIQRSSATPMGASTTTSPAGKAIPGKLQWLRTAHNDNVQGRVMTEFVYNELGLTTAATIHDGSPYAEQLQQVFADVFTELGGTITAQEAVNVGDTDIRPVLTSISTGNPEFRYYPIFTAEGGFITSQAKEVAGLEETVLAGADGMISPNFLEAAGDASEGMYVSGPDLAFTGDKYAKFVAEHTEMYGVAPESAFRAHAYDAANMIFDAIEKVATTDADGRLLCEVINQTGEKLAPG